MEKITYVTKVSKRGYSLYTNVPSDFHNAIKDMLGKQVKVTIEELT